MAEYVGEAEEIIKNIALSNWFETDQDKADYSSTSIYTLSSTAISNWYDVVSGKSDWIGEYLQGLKSTYSRTDLHPGLSTITIPYYKGQIFSNWFDSVMEKTDYASKTIHYIMNEVMPRLRGGTRTISYTSVGGRAFLSDLFNIMVDSNVNSESLLPTGVMNLYTTMNEYAFKIMWDIPTSIPYGKRITSYNIYRYVTGQPKMLVENLTEREFVSLRPTLNYHYYITAVMDALDGEKGLEFFPMNSYLLSEPQIIMENLEDNVLEKDGIYSTHSETSPSLNSIVFAPHSRDENGVELTMVKTLEMKADGTNHTIHILPSENGTKNFGSDNKRWNITFGSEIVTDVATTKTIQIHSGR